MGHCPQHSNLVPLLVMMCCDDFRYCEIVVCWYEHEHACCFCKGTTGDSDSPRRSDRGANFDHIMDGTMARHSASRRVPDSLTNLDRLVEGRRSSSILPLISAGYIAISASSTERPRSVHGKIPTRHNGSTELPSLQACHRPRNRRYGAPVLYSSTSQSNPAVIFA